MKIYEKFVDGESKIGVTENLSQVELCSLIFEKFPQSCDCYDSIVFDLSFKALDELKNKIIEFQKQFEELEQKYENITEKTFQRR